jgi:DNA-binding Lrp family transcriptional regulator
MLERALDEADRRIIGILQANAREPVVTLARKVGLSRSTVQERLRRLERSDVIQGYTVRLGKSAKRAPVSAYLLLYLQGPICERVAPAIARIPEVKKSQSIGGEIDMILQVETSSLEELNRVRNEVEAIPGVSKVTTGIVLCDRFDRSA